VFSSTDDLRIAQLRPLLPPAILMEELPLPEGAARFVASSRETIGKIVTGKDPRLLVVVGPCSIHDPGAALEYARGLAELNVRLQSDLYIVMRTYFEKPRTTVGWKGLINDPKLDNSFAINSGLRVARRFLLDVLELGLPTGTEFLDPISPQFVADLVCWGAIGARTSESQVHRELASGLSMPVGFKNGTGGSITVAVDAIRASVHPHHFLSVTKQGLAAIVETRGNPHTHLILRGGGGKTNYDDASVRAAVAELSKAGVNPHLMIDLSHANSGKDPARQPLVAETVAAQIIAGESHITGVMAESFLLGGNQSLESGKPLEYGKSITDGCLSWHDTAPLLQSLASAVAHRPR
jgi:3-deoxy-7-phosphoheptulonate synthase